ncbi:MAG: hypothetical protein HYY09_05265 [Firmicutes bacterium]|nr:hypothetical protein [Bacillota bacterium]
MQSIGRVGCGRRYLFLSRELAAAAAAGSLARVERILRLREKMGGPPGGMIPEQVEALVKYDAEARRHLEESLSAVRKSLAAVSADRRLLHESPDRLQRETGLIHYG